MPSLFIGAMTGSAFAIVADPIWTASRLDPGTFALVGMAAVFAGDRKSTRLNSSHTDISRMPSSA